ncbi:ABC transporter permease [Agrilactobacillus yilanensis]|uniref:ABC transporter permease n=1 Tax=Agrilactobacillus yilanensis TaxID=2485997 RepID=A0ABW4J9F4_9LACO|nr:ABC transporter permease [Agrilactobacillus yilanensis]
MITIAFIKKEIMETWRTRKILILVIVFFIFGILNPLTAKLTPELLKMSLKTTIPFPDPTSLDSWLQFYKNISQMGLYLFAIIFSGTMSHELAKGSLTNLLTKGLQRRVVIFSKGFVLFGQWLLSIGLCFIVTLGYTHYYFPDNKSPHIWLALWPLFIFGLLLVSLLLFTSTMINNNFGGLLGTVIVMIIFNLINLYKGAVNYNPISLVSKNLTIVKDDTKFFDLWPSMCITVGLAIGLLYLTVKLFDRKKL